MQHSSTRVLLVEDNPGDAFLVRELLQEAGEEFWLEHVHSLQAALKQLGQDSFEAILLDLSLPDASGLEGIQTITQAAPEIPVVVMTGLADEGVARTAVREGAQDYLVKGRADGVGLARAVRYAIERALRERERRLRELVEAQKRFLADAAHELRAPLTAIRGNLELLLRFPQMQAEERKEALHEAEAEAARLERLIHDLLSLARGEAGLGFEFSEVPLHEVVLEAWNEARHFGKGHGFELDGLEPAWVQGQRDRLKQLALIFLENAVKYTPPEGHIRLSLRCQDQSVLLRVSDTGPGIPREDLSRIFERFYRVRRPNDPGGSGLGLSIARWIVEGHGGKIWLESELGKGTVACAQLPRILKEIPE
ncbi:MAG: HAMP domain-containing histidine kinase [Thermaceae bacterium]|nr:HAMP domain-containing histidine kinase [Thermaceae bacterium]